jgi:hypothetical protein
MAEKRRKAPPRHLKTSGSHERMPARPSDRLENERIRQEAQAQEAPRGGHSSHENVVETPDNTKLFYEKLLPLAQSSHKKNQRFLRTGIIWLFALPVILYIIRTMTNGNKIAFLIIWIVGMFIIASFLIIVAYQDETLQQNLDELQEYVPEVEDNQLGRLKLLYPPEELEWLEDIDHELILETLKQEHKLPPLEAIMPGHEVTVIETVESENLSVGGGKSATEDVNLMWQHINDQTSDSKGGTSDA